MAFDGSYPREVREGGVVHRIFVRRARCRRCHVGEALAPDFLVRRRRDSTRSIAAAVLQHALPDLPRDAQQLYEGVPRRTQRSWRQRFSARADDLAACLNAFCTSWGAIPPVRAATPVGRAVEAIGALFRVADRRWSVPPGFVLANVVVGGQLLTSRADLPHPDLPLSLGRSRAP
jgi:hypothetical protein